MANTKVLSSIYAGENNQSSTISQKIARDSVQKDNSNVAINPFKIKKELLKRIDRKSYVDSSYYLG